MDAATELGRNSVSTRFSLSMEMSRLKRDGTTAETVSLDQILRRERGQENIHFLCSADHVQDWQPYPVDPYSCYICVTIHRAILLLKKTTWYFIINKKCFSFAFVWFTCMAINVSVQHNCGFLPGIILLAHFFLFSFPPTGGCSEGLDAFRFHL